MYYGRLVEWLSVNVAECVACGCVDVCARAGDLLREFKTMLSGMHSQGAATSVELVRPELPANPYTNKRLQFWND